MNKMQGAKVLIFNIDPASERGERLYRLLRLSGARCQSVKAKESGQSLGFLLGLDGFAENDAPQPAEQGEADKEALIFFRIAGQELDRLLSALKRAGIFIPLKAVVTEHNINWTLRHLIDELEQENSIMRSRQELFTRIKKYKGPDRELVREANALLSAHMLDKQELDDMIRRFSATD